MRLLVTLQQRFRKSPDGKVFANSTFNYSFFSRYLSVFDEVLVFARVCPGEAEEPENYRSDGPGVRFFEVPYYVGPFQYLRQWSALQASASQAVSLADAFLLRVPGQMGNLIWRELRKRHLPYGVEVVGDPWESARTCGAPFWMIPYLRWVGYHTLKQQCAQAAVAAYVTERTLQNRYPPGGWTTSYSSVELSAEHILDSKGLQQRLERSKEPFEGKRPFRVCNVGMMEALYKSQDTLIEAAALCCRGGLNVEVWLAGDGRYRSFFEQKAKESGIFDKVKFWGMLSAEQIRRMLDDSDLFVLPSLTEGLPRVLIEAMARGLPCLASQVGGNGELLAPEFLFPVKKPILLAQKIQWLLRDYLFIQKVSAENLERAFHYSADRLAVKRTECYGQLKMIVQSERKNCVNCSAK
jgi:glycosyltransferase involved in cell wall biosynthesis